MLRSIFFFALLLVITFSDGLFAQCSVNAGNDTTIYSGYVPLSCVTLTALATGQAPITFVWSTGDSTQSIVVCDSTATYIVTITDSSGCTASDTILVTSVNVNCHPNGKVLVCHVPPGNPANAHDICISARAVSAHLAHGDYLGACIALPPPAPICSVSLGPDVVICSGSSVTLDAGAGFASYLWSDSSSGQSLVVDSAGTYWVSVTDSSGCVAADTIVVSIDSSALMVDAGTDATIGCNDSCATLSSSVSGGTSPYTYSWSSGDSTATITVCDTISTTYYLTVSDTFGCSGTDSVNVTVASLIDVDAGLDLTLMCNDSCASLSATVSDGTPPFTFVWSTGDSTASITVCDTGTTTYYVTVTDSLGCTGTDSVTVTIGGNSCGINKVLVCHIPPGNPANAHNICISANAYLAHRRHGDYLGCCQSTPIGPKVVHFSASPNPAMMKVTLEYNLQEEADYMTIDLYSITGKKFYNVFEGYAYSNSGVLEVELREFPQGMYVAEIKTSGGEVYHQKFLLLK